MTTTYTWMIKNLNADMRGYAVTAFFEMQGVDEAGKTATGSVSVCFGAGDMKPMSQWTQDAIDAYAETKREYIEQLIAEKFNQP
jgi:hypothetical protein